MNAIKLSSRIYYIGVNDRTTSLFEGLWSLRHGVTYNSYLVKGCDKCAIIDGVEAGHVLQQIDAIRDVLGDRQPDYLIINHMEPDHSGGINLLRAAFPAMKIVGNAQTLAMLRGFNNITEGTVAVKDGDALSLGSDATLRFFLTPMVHWPETMMTLLEEEKALFSCDAFGCFGALNGAVCDSDMNADRYFPEMVRYYSCIVGKYGSFVQRALSKLSNIGIDLICPSHGPVWKENIAKVIDIYDRLSKYTPLDSGVTVIYGSMYGNTARMAETTAEALSCAGVRDIEVFDASHSDLSEMIAAIFRHKGIVIAAPTYSEGLFPPVLAVMEALSVRGIKNREILLMGSYTWSQQALKVMQNFTHTLEVNCSIESVSAKQAPTPEILQQCREAATKLAALLAK